MKIVVNIDDDTLEGDPILIESSSISEAIGSLKEIGKITQSDIMCAFMKDKRERLHKYTSCIYGWDTDNAGNMIPNWQEQKIIESMKAMRNKGYSYSKIANTLDSMGIKGKKGGKISNNMISRSISNPIHERVSEFTKN